jgi:CBS-domain-containing membrane protein
MWAAVLSVGKEETLPEAFKLLVEHNILAAPVLGKARHFLGFVDMLDFAQFIITEVLSPSSLEPC